MMLIQNTQLLIFKDFQDSQDVVYMLVYFRRCTTAHALEKMPDIYGYMSHMTSQGSTPIAEVQSNQKNGKEWNALAIIKSI